MLEVVTRCPMCGSNAQHRLFNAVPDFVFHATDETWPIDECSECNSLHLALRPEPSSISRYYDRYYTHEGEADTPSISGISVKSHLAKKLANSWRNFKYGSTRPSLGLIGVAAAALFPPLRGWIDAECRHLPAKKRSPGPLCVLDVGHGDGRFLKFVREIGHRAAGLELDPKAVQQARNEQLDVHNGDIAAALSIWGESHFDYITMSHVIEHVYDPPQAIAIASRLLKPGGILWIECPNPQSPGRASYGNRWRDLDPPRHICIPSLEALRKAADEAGMTFLRQYRRPFVPFEVYPFSSAASGSSARAGYLKAIRMELSNLLRSTPAEWLTLTFQKA